VALEQRSDGLAHEHLGSLPPPHWEPGSLWGDRSSSEETVGAPAGDGDAGLSQLPTEQTLGSLLDSLVKQQEGHLPWWSPQEPLLSDLGAVFEALGVEAGDEMLDQVLTVERSLTADNTDFLAGTILDQPGTAGVYTIWGASTVGDTEITVSLGGRRLVDAAILTLRANSEIRENEDTFFQMLSSTGGRPLININVVTAAVVRVRVKFLPAGPT